MALVIPLAKGAGPISRQVYLGLRGAIVQGTFRPGDRLPATRDLAEQLGVSRTVVLLAYEQLLSEGIIVNGSQQALDLAARVLMERGDRVVLEDPQYQGAREVFRAAGARLHPVPVDREGLNPAKLPASARIAFVTPSHQFPTGGVLPLARRLALLEWAKNAKAVVIEDDYDGEFRYEGQPVESMQGLDTEGREI